MRAIAACLALYAAIGLTSPFTAHAATDELLIGKAKEYSSTTYGFQASPISFSGRPLGYASANYPPQRFSKRYWVYLSCVLTPSDPDQDGECMEWRILDAATRHVSPLNLPGFDSFMAVPSFSWPYVAYVEIGKPISTHRREIYCVLFDYAKKRVVERQKQTVDESLFATDFPHMLLPPGIQKRNGQETAIFGVDDVGQYKTLCEIAIP